MDYEIISLPQPFSILVDNSPFVHDIAHEEIEEIWHREKKIRGDILHEGKILVFVRFDKKKVVARFVDYKVFFAQICDKKIARKLNLCSLGVSGITISGNQVLIGRRAKTMAHYPHYYELAPSGGIDPSAMKNGKINTEQQALIELTEETGIAASDVISIHPRLLIKDHRINTLEICIEIQVNPKLGEKEIFPTVEYEELFWLPQEKLALFFIEKKAISIPFSAILAQEILKKPK